MSDDSKTGGTPGHKPNARESRAVYRGTETGAPAGKSASEPPAKRPPTPKKSSKMLDEMAAKAIEEHRAGITRKFPQ